MTYCLCDDMLFTEDFMPKQSIKGTLGTAETIKRRRQELGLTIEEAASRAGVSIKTWYRYEAGESIRVDKYKGVCVALNLRSFPIDDTDNTSTFNLEYYNHHSVWSKHIYNHFGCVAAVSFVIGYDFLIDCLNDDMEQLSTMPKESHIGQIYTSMLKDLMPEQFLARYDYEFLFCMKMALLRLGRIANKSDNIVAHSVLDELLLYLIVEMSDFLIETMIPEIEACGIEVDGNWKDWIFDLFDDIDIITYLYSDLMFLTNDHTYHFENWLEKQFYMSNSDFDP